MGNENSSSSANEEPVANDISVKWTEGLKAHAVDGHCSAVCKNVCYVFGGLKFGDADGVEGECNDLYELKTGKLHKVETSGDLPKARSAACMAAIGNCLYLFGGVNHQEGWMDDVHKFNTETNIWTKIDGKGNKPSPRDKACCATIGSTIYLFGGFGPQSSDDIEEDDDDEEWESDEEIEDQQAAQFGWFKDLFTFNTETLSWDKPMQMNLSGPTPRAATAMCVLDKTLIVFGGRDPDGRTNDLFFFNTETLKWESQKVRGKPPAARSFHAMCPVSDSRVCVFGGRATNDSHLSDLHILDTAKGVWMEVKREDGCVWPEARGLHTLNTVADQLLLFGGSSDLDPETMQCRNFYSSAFTAQLSDLTNGGEVCDLAAENKENTAQKSAPVGDKSDCSPPKVRKTETEETN